MPTSSLSRTIVICGALCGAGICAAFAQADPQSATPSFEAASIKRNVSTDTRNRFETPPGRLNAINVPLRFLIRQAYRTTESRIVGGPSWIDKDRFDIVATTASAVNRDVLRDMLRELLKERFGLAIHMESREMPIYVLRLARPDATVGPNLRPSTMDCAGRGSSVVAGQVQCGILVSQGANDASLRGGAATMDNFVRLLGDFLARPIEDRTGLTGIFDLELQFTAERSSTPGAPVPGGLPTASNVDTAPSVFTALQEQLGLTLEATRGRADVWVVDGASVPAID